MKNLTRSFAVAAGAVILAAAGAASLAAQGGYASAKGIYRDADKPAVKFSVLLTEGDRDRAVAVSHAFASGDRFKFQVEANKGGYVYIINRTMAGDPEELSNKGISRVVDDDRRTPSKAKYTLLWPKNSNQKMTAGRPFTVPATFRMDNNPGVEKLYVVVSETPLNMGDYFDVASGRQREGGTPARGRRDTNEDVTSQLSKQLAAWAANGQTEVPTKGIEEVDGYGIVRDATKPATLEVSLKHFAK